MESITAARNISGLEPMSVLHGIAPLCVPMSVSGDFADEVGNRAVPRIVSLWERLGLFYMLGADDISSLFIFTYRQAD